MTAAVGARRTVGDERLALFPDERRELTVHSSIGVTLRQLAWKGFAPVVRVNAERNRSTIGLYRYDCLYAEFGLARAF